MARITTMPWCGEDLIWLGSTLETVGLVFVAVGAALLLIGVGMWLRRRKAGCTNKTASRGFIKWSIFSIVAILLCTVALSLVLSENSPLSRGNEWSRANYAAVRAFKDGRPAEAESLGKVALELAEQLEGPGDRVCASLANLREYTAAQGRIPSAWSYSLRLAEICDIEKHEPASGRRERDSNLSALHGGSASRGKDQADDLDRTMDLLGPDVRRAIEQMAYEMDHLEDHLTKQTSVDKLEAVESSTEKPFDHLHEQWLALKAHIQEGDELWHWTTSEQTWAYLCGRSGIALVRDKNIIGGIITEMN